jgi:predicted cupin superfamily sugar epimerase
MPGDSPSVAGCRRIFWSDKVLAAEQLINLLDLKPLPREGGWYRETYRADLLLPSEALPSPYGARRAAGTAIYYLLTLDTCSALHRLPGDEVFHFYLGDPVEMFQLDPQLGAGRILTLGVDLLAGQRPQVVVPGGVWQGSWLRPGGAFALMGTTMAPGFDFADYEHADPSRLAAAFPDFAERIRSLCPTP